MQWIKSHLTIVICGAVSIVAIVMLVLGMLSSDVVNAMQEDLQVYNDLKDITPTNERIIDRVKQQQATNKQRLQEIMGDVAIIGDHKPLLPEVFPKVDISKHEAAPYRFRDLFKEKQKDLIKILRAKDAPSQEEIKEAQESLNKKREFEAIEKGLGQFTTKGKSEVPGGTSPDRSTAFGTPAWRPSDEKAIQENVDEEAALNLSIQRAQDIYCYASQDSLVQCPGVTEGSGAPTEEDMWYAQVYLWIQEDVLRALNNLNEQVANKLPGENRWVGYLPVKRLIVFDIEGYVPPNSGTPDTSVFTQRNSNESRDIIRFSVTLVVEAPMLPAVINEICGAGFYTPLLVNYQPPDDKSLYYIYGTAPVIQVDIRFEGCFMRSKYEQWMPQSVKDNIKEGKTIMGMPGGSGSPGREQRQFRPPDRRTTPHRRGGSSSPEMPPWMSDS